MGFASINRQDGKHPGVYQYIGITVHLYTDACTGAQVHRYDNTQVQGVDWYTGTPKRRHNGTLEHRGIGTLMPWYTSTLVYQYTGTPVQKHTGTPIYRYTSIPIA